MTIETTYSDDDLERGKCKSCGERTMIVPAVKKCPDCIEEIRFMEMTMNEDKEDED